MAGLTLNASVVTLKLLIAIYGCVNGRYTIHNGRILEITLNATDFTQKTAAGITCCNNGAGTAKQWLDLHLMLDNEVDTTDSNLVLL